MREGSPVKRNRSCLGVGVTATAFIFAINTAATQLHAACAGTDEANARNGSDIFAKAIDNNKIDEWERKELIRSAIEVLECVKAPSAETLGELGNAYLTMHRIPQANWYLRRAATQAEAEHEPNVRQAAEASLTQISHDGTVSVRMPSVGSIPPVQIDDEVIAPELLVEPIPLEAGTHWIQAKRGDLRFLDAIELQDGEALVVNILLEPPSTIGSNCRVNEQCASGICQLRSCVRSASSRQPWRLTADVGFILASASASVLAGAAVAHSYGGDAHDLVTPAWIGLGVGATAAAVGLAPLLLLGPYETTEQDPSKVAIALDVVGTLAFVVGLYTLGWAALDTPNHALVEPGWLTFWSGLSTLAGGLAVTGIDEGGRSKHYSSLKFQLVADGRGTPSGLSARAWW
jgi:hypothetical protein